MRRKTGLLVMSVVLACMAVFGAQVPPDDETVWRAFIAWFKTAPPSGNPLASYPATLEAAGTPQPEIQRRMGLIARLFGERSDWVELYFDKAFARPATGNPARDGFASAPSAFLADAVKGLSPGTALDAGMGQGRNAIYLASQGWTATGFDLSGEAVRAARANAAKAGVRIETAKASYADFDFGTGKWDLIVLAFAWAPVTDAGFVAKLSASLSSRGRVVFEHFIDDPASPRRAAMHTLMPEELRTLFKDFRIERYEEVIDTGDWGGPGQRLVRMVAAKPQDQGR
jgi:SAM-dependent methyltransferase